MQPQTSSHQPLRGLPLVLTLIVIGATLIIGVVLLLRDIHPAQPPVQTAVINPTTTGTITLATSDGLTSPKTFVDPSPGNFDKKIFSLNNADALRKTGEKSWSVKGGRLFMQVHRNPAGAFVVRFVYPYEDFLPKDTMAMLRTRWIMTETYKLMDELAITPQQWEKLSALKLNTDTQISAEDRKKIMALFKEAIAAMPNDKTIDGSQPSVPEEKLRTLLSDRQYKSLTGQAAVYSGTVQSLRASGTIPDDDDDAPGAPKR